MLGNADPLDRTLRFRIDATAVGGTGPGAGGVRLVDAAGDRQRSSEGSEPMSDELLPYYNRELAFLRRLGAEFAEAHPKIAGRLRLDPDAAEDPHVERLIEAFAYLNARTRFKLDDDFPEITDALLGVLYPHYQAPCRRWRSCRFSSIAGRRTWPPATRSRPDSALETDPIDGEPCRFRTCYPTTLWPIEMTRPG